MNIEALLPLTNKVIKYPADASQPESAAISRFAISNGFQYELSRPDLVSYSLQEYKSLPAWLGLAGIGFKKDAYHVVAGEYMGYSFHMFLMWDQMAEGTIYKNPTEEQKLKFAQQQTTGIVRVKLPKLFPQVVLDSSKNDKFRSSVGSSFESSQRLSLEGDFSSYFDLYAPVGLQVNVLTLLAPNMMQILKNHAGLFDIEFYKDEMILMTKASLYDPAVLAALDAALSEQLTYLNRLLASWNYIPKQQPVDLLKKPFFNGRSLKIGTFRISPAAQIGGILTGFLIIGIISAIYGE